MIATPDIIATVGPSCWSDEKLRALLLDGDVRFFRFPFSKEIPETHIKNSLRLHSLAAELHFPVQAMADLPGAKPRLSNDEPINVVAGRQRNIYLTQSAPDDSLFVRPRLAGPLPNLTATDALLGDGENSYHITSLDAGVAAGYFTFTGVLERRLALTIPGVAYTIESFTVQDRDYCVKLANNGFESVALSFTQSRQDIESARAWLASELGWDPRIVAKIESANGCQNAEEIAQAADAVMVARGDLALQIGLENLWVAQREIVAACIRNSTYVIVATGLLDSLVAGTRPSRSEAIDIAAAADLGASALLLSAETSIGVDPINAVLTLRRLAVGQQAGQA